jgi:hypothetical protein
MDGVDEIVQILCESRCISHRQTAPDTDAGEIRANNNSENQIVLEEQEKEQELSSVGQTESITARSDQQTEKKEQGISNSNLEDYSCYYCKYNTDSQDDYERHVIKQHGLGHQCYPSKADIERLGLKPQGKSWEI